MHARVNGTEIFFDVVGAGHAVEPASLAEKPTLVVLHGGPGLDHSGYRPWLDPLGNHVQLIYLDHRGNGRSGRPDPATYTVAQMADDLDALRRHLGLGPIDVLGHSFGGKVAMVFALRHPCSLRRLVLSNCAAAPAFGHDARAAVERLASPEQLALLPSMFTGRITSRPEWDAWWRVCMPLYFRHPDPDVVAGIAARGTGAYEVAMHMFAGELSRFDVRDRLGDITAPTLIVAGRHDWVTPPGQAEDIHQRVPGSQLVVLEDSGHMGFVEEQATYLDHVRRFLTAATPLPAGAR